ncbi:hypothetical protein ACQ4PT_033644 [Festuca glaucescens]
MQQKLLYMILVASRKLRHYFQGHPITVVTSYPLEQVLRNPNVTGRMAEWAVELQPFELTFETTKVIKSKAPVEFIVEWTDPYAGEAREEESTLPGVSNNIAEYEGLLARLRAGGALGIKRLIVKGDSQLVVNFSNKSYTPKDEHMAAYLEEHRKMEKRFLGMEPSATPPVESNELLAEELPPPPTTGAPDYGPPSGDRTVLTLTCQDEVDWITELKSYLVDGKLPEGNEEAEHVARQASGYCIKDGDLYRHRPNGIALKCISVEEGRELLSDIHAGECGHHSLVSTLAGKVYRSGFYWPSTLTNAIELVRAYEACQFHAKQIHQPPQEMQTIPLTWPFAFTKWAEVEPARTIPASSAVNFIKGLVCRFGVPCRIITDNGSQLTSGLFRAYCASIGTKICYASVAHPRSNGQAERANAEVLKGLKIKSFDTKLKACGKKWLDNLQPVLWSIHTTATKSTGKTPFFLVYGAEAVLPIELKHGSPRVLAFDESCQEELLKDRLFLLEEARCRAALRAARYQQGLRRYPSRHVCPRTLEAGDLVLRRILSREGLHKLSPMWEGPFRVKHISRPSTAWLETEEGELVQNTWNIQNLRKFYP